MIQYFREGKISVGITVDLYFLDLGLWLQEPLLRTVVIMFFIANEGLSMLENAAAIGVPIPKRLVEALEALKEKGE